MPYGSYLGLLLFLLSVNDNPEHQNVIVSRTRTKMLRQVYTVRDLIDLQRDIHALSFMVPRKDFSVSVRILCMIVCNHKRAPIKFD